MEKKTTTPIRTALTGLILATVGAFGAAHSQTLSSFEFESNNYSTSPINGTCNQNTQKVLHRDDSSIVIFNPSLGNGGANFTLMLRGSVYGQTSKMPAEYTINDFDILNDTVYICGRHDVEGDTLSHGFIGYVAINDLFSPTGGICTYSDIRSTTNLQKVLAYHDNSGEIVAAAFGTCEYAGVVYVPAASIEQVEQLSGPVLPIPEGVRLREYRNMGANPLKQRADRTEEIFISQEPCTYDCITHLKLGDKHSIEAKTFRTFKKKMGENIVDMRLMQDYVCLVSREKDEEAFVSPDNRYVIYRIDKNDFSNNQSTVREHRLDKSRTVDMDFNEGMNAVYFDDEVINLGDKGSFGYGAQLIEIKDLMPTP